MKATLTIAIMSIVFYSTAQDIIYTTYYKSGLVSKDWKYSRSKKWILLRPIDFPFNIIKVSSSTLTSIHFSDGLVKTFSKEKKPVIPLFESNPRTAEIEYSYQYSFDSVYKADVMNKLKGMSSRNFSIFNRDIKNKDSMSYVIKLIAHPRSEQREQHDIYFDLDISLKGGKLNYHLSKFIDVRPKLFKSFEWSDKTVYATQAKEIKSVGDYYRIIRFKKDYWIQILDAISEIQSKIEYSLSSKNTRFQFLEYSNKRVKEESSQETVSDSLLQKIEFNDVIITTFSVEKKIHIIKEGVHVLNYYEKNDSSNVISKQIIDRKKIYLIDKEDEEPIIVRHRRIKRFGDYFIFDKNGIHLGIVVSKSDWVWNSQHHNGQSQTLDGFSFSPNLGCNWYLRSDNLRFKNGISLDGRVDFAIDGRLLVAPTILLGYVGLRKLNREKAIEFGLKVGANFTVSNFEIGSFIPIPMASVLNNTSYALGVASITYRYRSFSIGAEFLYGIRSLNQLENKDANRKQFGLSIAKVF